MKKLFSILFALIVLLSGMHISLATHICKGEVSARKLSFIGNEATCEMESSKQSCPTHQKINTNCCQNQVVVYSIDDSYEAFAYKINELAKKVIQEFSIPLDSDFNSNIPVTPLHNNSGPPIITYASAVSLADICVFRI